ncbi:MAG: hypothetical protein FWG02_00860 [Holophagaceae bacterium]|nr:hypothetical protein [Holophagaceae bacterium]
MAKWAQYKEFGAGAFRLYLLLGIYRFFGKRVLKVLIFPIVFTAFIFMKNARRASWDYFARLYSFSNNPELKPSFIKTFRHLYSFAISLIDKIGAWIGDITETEVVYKDEQAVNRFFESLKARKGVFILCSHLGNIELLRAMATSRKEKIVVNGFIEAERTQDFNAFIAKMNPDSALNLIPIKDIGIDTASHIKTKLEEGEVVVMAADREPSMNEKGSALLPFLGGSAFFPKGAFRFLKVMKCDFCFVFICRNETGKYDVHVDYHSAEMARNPDEVMKKFVVYLEKLVLKYPYQWYNFYTFWH